MRRMCCSKKVERNLPEEQCVLQEFGRMEVCADVVILEYPEKKELA